MEAKSESGASVGPKSPPRLLRSLFLAVLAGLVINAVLGLLLDFEEFASTLATVQLWEVMLPFALVLLVYFIDAIRFKVLFRQFGIRLSFRDSLYSNVIGLFFSGITPSSAGGQPFQIYHFTKLGLDSTTATNIVFSRLMVSNLAQVVVIVLFAGQGLSLLGSSGNAGFILGIGLFMTLAAGVLLFFVFARPQVIGRFALAIEASRLGRLISRLSKDEHWAEKLSAWSLGLGDSFSHLWAKRLWLVLLDLAVHVFDQVLWAFGLYVPLVVLTGTTVPFGAFLFAFNLCGFVSTFIPTPGASGSIEASYSLVLGGLTGAPGAALSAVVLWRFGSYYLHLVLGGLVYFFVRTGTAVYSRGSDGITRRTTSWSAVHRRAAAKRAAAKGRAS